MNPNLPPPSHESSYSIRPEITCPHCWTTFPTEEMLWIAEAPDLLGDTRLGETEKERFLPSIFDVSGNAIDRRGFLCKKLACPHCHLMLPASLLETAPYIFSIAGAPGSGKSYFMTAMTWNLRRIFSQNFNILFTDADPEMNVHLLEYESEQFMNDDDEAMVKIEKTQEQGDLYNTVRINDQLITYLQPFLFSMTPTSAHPCYAIRDKVSLSVALYDNAGESFLPTRDSNNASLPVTRHLGKSRSIFFIFDPIQDNRFRAGCKNLTNDPQLKKDTFINFNRSPLRQEMILTEVIKRTRLELGLRSHEKYPHPFIIAVSKLDAWRDLIPDTFFREPWAKTLKSEQTIFMKSRVQEMSVLIRNLLLKYIPEMVTQVENFADNVVYIPVSATGGPPTFNEKTSVWGFQMKNIKSIWVEVPFLYALSETTEKLIATH